MELLKIIVFEYLLGYVLQGFSIVLGIYALNRQKIIFRKYFLIGFIVSIFSFLVRLLPISFGIHTMLNLIFVFLVCMLILKMSALKTISSALILTIVLLIVEVIDVAIMIQIFGAKTIESHMLIPSIKAKLILPGNIFYFILNLLAYMKLTKVKNGEKYGDISEESC